jgi:hypothetical protein
VGEYCSFHPGANGVEEGKSFNPEPTATAAKKAMKNAKPRMQNAESKATRSVFS